MIIQKNRKPNDGFTLIELLVVISIIGVLAGIALVSFSGAQKQARDTQRKSDLKQYQTSIEQFANNNNGFYPAHTTDITMSTTFCGAGGEITTNTCPEDPRNSEDPTQVYQYISNGTNGLFDAYDYVLWGKLETSGNYWVYCSTGLVDEIVVEPASSVCPI